MGFLVLSVPHLVGQSSKVFLSMKLIIVFLVFVHLLSVHTTTALSLILHGQPLFKFVGPLCMLVHKVREGVR